MLGKPAMVPVPDIYGKKILEKAKKLESQGLNVRSFSEFVPYDKYFSLGESCDFILCPIIMKTWGEGLIEEIAGLSRAGSGPLEAVRFEKPIIVPEAYLMPDEFKSSTIKYKNEEDLKSFIEDMIKNPEKVIKYEKEAEKNAKKFSLPILHKYFEETILKEMDIL